MSATPNGFIEYQAQNGLDKLFQRVSKLESNDYFRPSVFSGNALSIPPTDAELDALIGTPQSYNGNALVLVKDTTNNLFWLVFGDTVAWYIQRVGAVDNFPLAARVYSDVDIKVNDITDVDLPFTDALYDFGGFWNIANPTRLTIPVGGTGVYSINGNVRWTADVNGRREVHVRISTSGVSLVTDIVHPVQLPAAVTAQNIVTDVYMEEGDYVELRVHQNSGIDLDIQTTVSYSPAFSIHKVF